MLAAIPDARKMLFSYATTAIVRLALLVWQSEFFLVWYNYYTKICGKTIDRGAADVLISLFNYKYQWSKLKDNCFTGDLYNVFYIRSHTTASPVWAYDLYLLKTEKKGQGTIVLERHEFHCLSCKKMLTFSSCDLTHTYLVVEIHWVLSCLSSVTEFPSGNSDCTITAASLLRCVSANSWPLWPRTGFLLCFTGGT